MLLGTFPFKNEGWACHHENTTLCLIVGLNLQMQRLWKADPRQFGQILAVCIIDILNLIFLILFYKIFYWKLRSKWKFQIFWFGDLSQNNSQGHCSAVEFLTFFNNGKSR